jgi:hypothetical protein
MKGVTYTAIPCRHRDGRIGRWASCCLIMFASAGASAQVILEAESSRLPQVDLVMLADTMPSASGPQLNWNAHSQQQQLAPAHLNLGLRWRPTTPAGRQIDAQMWRRVTSSAASSLAYVEDTPEYGARVEMQISPAKRSMPLRDLLGMQLDNGARLSLRPRNGKVSLYYRKQF